MKKFYLLTKTLLVVALLCVGQNAWGQTTTTLLEYGTNEVPWTESKMEEWTTSSTWMTRSLITEGLRGKNKNGTEYLRKTISPDDGVILNISAEFNLLSNNGRNINVSANNAHGSYFRFGNIYIIENSQNQQSYYSFSDCKSSGYTYTQFTYAANHRPNNGNDGLTEEQWNAAINAAPSYYVEMEINTATNILTSFKVYPSSAKASTLVNITNQALSNVDYSTIEIGFLKGSSMSYSSLELLKSLKVTQTTQSATYADYTVHYKDNNGATVKDDEVRNGEVGSTVNANNVDKETFYNGGYKYVYANDGGGTTVANDGSAEFTVTYTKYGQYTYNVYAVNSSSVKLQDDPIATATTYEGEEATLTWSKYIKIGGTWYSTSETTFRTTATEAGSRNVVYSASDIAYFYEMENLTRSGGAYLTETDASYSNFNRLRLSKGSTYYTPALTGGTYQLSIPWVNSNGSASEVYVYTRSSGGVLSEKLLTFTATGSSSGTFTGDIAVPEGYSIAFNGNEGSINNNARMDYMTLTLKAVPVTVSAAGFATYVPSYDLDFSATAIEAYKVKVSSKGVATLTKVNNVPAGTPVLLYKDGGATEDIPVMTGAATVTENDLVAGTGAAVATTDGDYTNMILNNVDGIGFYFANGQTVAANRAYLHIASTLAPDPVNNARMAMRFAGAITSIDNVEAAAETKTQDGKFIENGKIVIVKNGVKYNAAGAQVK